MVSVPLDSGFWKVFLVRAISRSALPVAAVSAGCCIGFGALCAYAWFSVDPACHCPAEKIDAARILAREYFPVGLILSGALSFGFLWVGKKLAWPTKVSSPSVVSCLCALIVCSVLGFLHVVTGRFSRVPIEWVVPPVLREPTAVISGTVQSWIFLVFIFSWAAGYVAIRGMRSSFLQDRLARFRQGGPG